MLMEGGGGIKMHFFHYYKLDDFYFSHYSTCKHSVWIRCLLSTNNYSREISNYYTSLY